MAIHNTLTSAQVHEPKHITDTTTADAGKVITPAGGGTSELRFLTPEEVGINFYYLEWGVQENATAISLTAAAVDSLYDAADYVNITSANLPGATSDEGNGITFSTTDYNVTIPADGIYKTEFWANVVTEVNNTKVGFRFTLNNTPASAVVKHDVPTANRPANISATSVSQFSAGDKVGISIAADKTTNILIEDIKVTFIMLREL